MILDVTRYDENVPFLLIDVDGVLNAINRSQNRKTYEIFRAGPYTIRFRRELGEWLERLGDRFHLVWCTMWDDYANADLAPWLDLPPLPYVPCADAQFEESSRNGRPVHPKVPCIEAHLKDRAFAWIDDTFESGDFSWAAVRDDEIAPTHLLPIDPRMGLLEHHVSKLTAWAERIA